MPRLLLSFLVFTLPIYGCYTSHDLDGDASAGRDGGARDDSATSTDAEPPTPPRRDAEPPRPPPPPPMPPPMTIPEELIAEGCEQICNRALECIPGGPTDPRDCLEGCFDAVPAREPCGELWVELAACVDSAPCDVFRDDDGLLRFCEGIALALAIECDVELDGGGGSGGGGSDGGSGMSGGGDSDE